MYVSRKRNKGKISAPEWHDKFELPDGSYSVYDIQDYFKYVIKRHKILTENLPIRIYVNRSENKITFKVKSGYYLELLIPETMVLLGSTEYKITKDKNSENVPHLKFAEVILLPCNLVNNGYQ